MICDTGGVAVLAHPWALKNTVAIIRSLSEAGLHGMEVYRSDGKLTGMQSENQLFCFRLSIEWYRLYLNCQSPSFEIIG